MIKHRINKKIKILTVVGARPQFIKSAVVSDALKSDRGAKINEIVVNTGQHYDKNMSDIFYAELNIQEPKYNLNAKTGSIYVQLADITRKLGDIVNKERPDIILVYGDTTSTLSASLVSSILDTPLIHVESGERIYRRNNVPEEKNRIVTDHLSSLALTSTYRAIDYLRREGFSNLRVKFVGDPMYDLFLRYRKKDIAFNSEDYFDYSSGKFNIATIHRAQNTDNIEILQMLLESLDESNLPVILPLHPRVSKIIKKINFNPKNNLKFLDPLGYEEFNILLRNCNKVFTDSGGVTREAFFAQKPCIIPMENSWWSEVVESGWAVEVGIDKKMIINSLNYFEPENDYPEGLFGDGDSSKIIIKEILKFAGSIDLNKEFAWHRHGYLKTIPKSNSSNFTYSNYRKIILQLMNSGYSFKLFHQAKKLLNNKNNKSKFVLMRHDIDISLEKALKMAKIEYEESIKSTYFIMLRNDFYNIFSENGSDIIRKIIELGHEIALHFDYSSYDSFSSEEQIAKLCNKECRIIEKWFDIKIKIISYHRPNKIILSGRCSFSHPLPHTYMPLFTKNISYMSDSRGEWRYDHPLDSQGFKEGRSLHILIHPIWWNDLPVDPYHNLQKFIDTNQNLTERLLSKNNTVYRVGEYADIDWNE